MDALLAKRTLLKRKLTRIKTKIDVQPDIHTAKVQEEQIAILYSEFNQLFDEIISTCPTDEDVIHQDQYDEIAERFDEAKVAIRRILHQLSGVSQSTSGQRPIRETAHGQNDVMVKLPKFDIPTFSGNILEWTSFSDLFTSSIHDHPTLKGSQKLKYLKNAVTGEAAELIAEITISDANYNEAWEMLSKRYKNKRKLISSHLTRLLEMPYLKTENGTDLRRLVDTASSVVRAMKALERPLGDNCDLAMLLISNRLDVETHKLWESKLGRDAMPKLSELLDFLDERAAILHSSEFGKQKVSVAVSSKQNGTNNNKKAIVHQTTVDNTCLVCTKAIHPIYSCPEFLELTVPERRAKVKKLSLCFNCMRIGHTHKCFSKSTCKRCEGKHNTLLHLDTPMTTDKTVTATVSAHMAVLRGDAKRALLSTALVNVTDAFGEKQIFRALIDPGADVSFVSERCVQILGIVREHSNVGFNGLGSKSVGRSRGFVQLSLGSRYDAKFQIDVNAYVMIKVTGTLPRLPCNKEEIANYKDLQLADPSFYKPGQVDLLLGNDIFFSTIRVGQRSAGEGLPGALNTVWGWIIGGECPSQNFISASVHHVQCEENLDEILTKFWETEKIMSKSLLTSDEKKCEKHFLSTTVRDSDGRFIVELPFKEGHIPLGNSRNVAVQRLKQMERALHHKPDRKQQYLDFMKEYQLLGHMELVPPEELLKPDHEVYYLPHHAIIKEASTTTKLRVVFDASSKTTSDVSLNDVLFTGPKLQDDLFVILVRFRMFIVAFTADICKMFRQIWVAKKHTDFQRIVWRESPNQPILDYRLTTVTYGISSAPYLSKRCLAQLADDGVQQFPLASQVVRRDYYMDDLMSGAMDVHSAIELQKDVLSLMNSSKMELRKWSSCNEELLDNLEPNMREIKTPFRIDEDDVIKTLGLHWIPGSDLFWFKVCLPPEREVITKRTISSDIAKVFDPLGLVAPAIVVGKLLMQKLWCLKIEWDEAVPDDVQKEWLSYRNGLNYLEEIKIPRCLITLPNTSYQLIGFSDASEVASAALVYVRSLDAEGNYNVKLVAAKTKLAPLKQISLPRLELTGAVLLVRLMENVAAAFITKPESMLAYSDSTIVLAWIKGHPKQWDTYVANRVSIIQEFLPHERWRHVPGIQNPADCASRGITSVDLISHPLWWEGPEWLKQSDFPEFEIEPITDESLLEARRKVIVHHIITDLELLHRFSSLTKLQRITAYCKRFAQNCRLPKQERTYNFLSSNEIHLGLIVWVRLVQQNCFPTELEWCSQKELVPAKSNLKCLNPFLDENGLLRVGGRLRHAKIAITRKFPIILPNNHIFTSMIINHEHNNTLHGGAQLVLASIQRRFWIINGRDAVRRQIRKCVTCRRYRAETATQMMGDLPSSRINPYPVFKKVGVDFTGPYTLRVLKGRGNRNYKGYIAIFICMVTRAMHLEVVTRLSSEAFIATLKRFVSRRGIPTDMYSDCGRNFVGADKELRHLWKSSGFKSDVGSYLSGKAINWHFNPPSSPHFGGLWEAGIKSVKYHLQRVMRTTVFNYEEMETVIIQIEACLNSRPISALSSDPNDLDALTPGHFITGSALKAIPEQNLVEEPISHLSRWKLQQKITQQFWKRWSSEYLTRLQQRPKWVSQREPLQIGDLVLVKDERLPPLRWKMARILQSHPGQDGISRVFTLKTANGILKRPLVKLCPLPIEARD